MFKAHQRWRSIDSKLPLLASALVLATVAVLGFVAHTLLVRALTDAAGGRLAGTATVVAELISRPTVPRTDPASLSADALVRAYAIGNRGPASRFAALAALGMSQGAGDSSKVWAALTDTLGRPVLTYNRGVSTGPRWPLTAIASGAVRGDSLTLSPIEGLGGMASYSIVRRLRASPDPKSDLVGYTIETRRLLGRGIPQVRALIGPGVEMLLGQPGSGTWTDLQNVAAAPPVDLVSANGGFIRFDGGVGAVARVAGTNWLVWLSQPLTQVLAPADNLIWDLLPFGLLIAFVGAALMFRIARRITHPVVELTHAAESIARDANVGTTGEHIANTAETPRDELARLRSAFGRMAKRLKEREGLEEQLRQAQKMDAIGRLAGGVAHDFNNLLTAIRSYSDLLLDDMPVWDTKRADVVEIRSAADRAAALTAQLLAFSRKSLLQPRVLNTRSVVADLRPMLRRLVAEDIDLVVDASPELWAVRADRSQLEQVIVNLVVNARDSMPRGGALTIAAANEHLPQTRSARGAAIPPGDFAVIRVSDTGQGMDADTQRRAFEPFFTTKGVGQGTGLGLASVDGIVAQSGGYLDLTSGVGRGTTVTVYLPRVSAEVDPTEQPGPSEPRGNNETILLVEDEPAVRALAHRVLTRAGYQVLESATPSDALREARASNGGVRLLLTDVVMPEMNGPALASRIAELCPNARVLYMSGYTDAEVIGRGLDEPTAMLLQKPFSAQQLVERVRLAIAS
jgi:signal transduction histidine kinase